MGDDLDIDDLAVLLMVPAYPGLFEFGDWSRRDFQRFGSLFLRANILKSHPEKLVSRVAITMNSRIVDGEECQRLRVINPHWLRVVLKQQTIPMLGIFK